MGSRVRSPLPGAEGARSLGGMRIEASPSGRASCRGCKKAIAKGELRFAETYTMPGSDTEAQRYWHLACAADKAAGHLRTAMDAYTETIPDRAALEATMSKATGKSAEGPLPHVDRAPTSRARCMGCDAAIEKGSYRVAVEREVDTGTFVTKGPGYLHPGCALAWAETNAGVPVATWTETVLKNSAVPGVEAAAIKALLAPG